MATSLLPQLDLFADPIRARLLILLEPRELSVGDLGDILQIPQPTVSRHLKALCESGWLTSRAEGTTRFYRAERPAQPASAQLWELVRQDIAATADARRDAERGRHVIARREAGSTFFDGSAGEWDAIRAELFGGRVELLPLLGLLDPDAVVGDLGTGTGQLALTLAPFVARVIAVDGSPAMLDVARARLRGATNVELREGQLESLPIDDASLHLAVLSLVLTYAADPGQVIAEAARTLRPGGRLLLVDLDRHDQVELRQRFGQRWPGFAADDFRSWLSAAGLVSPRVLPLPPAPDARGPLLLAASAVKPGPHA
jgi:ArsR family transcriptional regulator